MSKIKINRPVQITLDDPVYGIDAIELENTNLKVYSSIPYNVELIRNDRRDKNLMEVTLLDGNNKELVKVISKQNHTPESKAGEIFLNEEDCIDAIRTLTQKSLRKAEKIMELVSANAKFYENVKSIAPNPNAKDVYIDIKKSGKVEIREDEKS